MEDLIGEIYFSKRQNVSLKNLLVMHKGLLSLRRFIFKEKCWDNFYILITEKDWKKLSDIKIAWGWGCNHSVKQEGSQKKCINSASILKLLLQSSICISVVLFSHLHRHFDTSKENGREEGTEKRPLCSAQVSHNPTLPTTSPFFFFFPRFPGQILNWS